MEVSILIGSSIVIFILGILALYWYGRWNQLLDSVRIYLRHRDDNPKLRLCPADLYEIVKRERDEGNTLLPKREHVQMIDKKN